VFIGGIIKAMSMVYHSYLDDSKDQSQSKMVISAGFYGTQNDWAKLRAAWTGCLKRNQIEYFKTSEYKMLTGQFARFRTGAFPPPQGREEAMKIRSELQQVFSSIPGIQGIGIAIPLDDHDRVCSRPEASEIFVGSPYRRAFESVMYETVQFIRRIPGRNVVSFVHDDGPDIDELRAYYLDFKETNPKTAKLMRGFQAMDDKLHPPLQMADMVANFTLGIGLEWLSSGRPLSKLKEMEGSIKRLSVWTEQYMLAVLKQNLIRSGRPVPSDLQSSEFD
jgi:hypothetical protein